VLVDVAIIRGIPKEHMLHFVSCFHGTFEEPDEYNQLMGNTTCVGDVYTSNSPARS
jgi:hypothetical protein